MSFEASDNNVVIEIFEPEIKYGGIIIPAIAQDNKSSGTVVSVGNEVKDKRIKRGSIVYTVKGAGKDNSFKNNGKKYVMIKDYDILAFTEN